MVQACQEPRDKAAKAQNKPEKECNSKQVHLRANQPAHLSQGRVLAARGESVEPAAQYVLMAIAITLMVPFYQIDVLAPFSAAFTKIPGWGWCQYMVSVGAVFGIGTVLLVRGRF